MSGNGVIVVGAINVDFVVATDRLPGPGETVVGAGMARHGGGKGANAAVAAARAGATVRLVGAVGADDTGVAALNELRAEGIAVDDVAVLDGEPTGVALIVVDAEGENQNRARPRSGTPPVPATASTGCSARLAAGDGLADAVRTATVAASLSVAHAGARAGMPTAAAIDAALRD
ncbi:PfkB family carbohydrate kinase [Pseudonocardia acidicola]|uniref:Carbohydrate kinase PfkB domain-containing protein n=1 Tax=Pseudonocardia acidicola TaxID=2724939 RepID=A0ABX1SJL3_9PSEU|nr:PfkB family carbohydrate kinase [Pseudonocardia acidicola]NMI00708.1 hypothetical protein [Pseudonocardia acidicola]